MNIRNKDLENFNLELEIPDNYKHIFREVEVEEEKIFCYNFSLIVCYLFDNCVIKKYEIYNISSFYNTFLSFCRRKEYKNTKQFENIIKNITDIDYNGEISAYFSNKSSLEYFSSVSSNTLNDDEKKLRQDIEKYFKTEKFKKIKLRWDNIQKIFYTISKYIITKYPSFELKKEFFNYCNGVVNYKRKEKSIDIIRLKKIESKKELDKPIESVIIESKKELEKPIESVIIESKKDTEKPIENIIKEYEEKILTGLSYQNDYKQEIKLLKKKMIEKDSIIKKLKENENIYRQKINNLENRYNKKNIANKQKKFLEVIEYLKNNISLDFIKLLEDNCIEKPEKFDYKNICFWLNKNEHKIKNITRFSDIKIYKYDTFLKFKKKNEK